MRTKFLFRSAMLPACLLFTSLIVVAQNPDQKGNDNSQSAAKSGKQETEKKKLPADPELAAFQKQLDETPLPKLKELYASEYNAWVRWQQQNHFGSGCQLKREFATTKEKETQLVSRCQAWKQKIDMIERTIKTVEKTTPERQAFERQLDAMPMPKLRELYASESASYQRWRDQNQIDAGCKLSSALATTKERETELVAKCKEWQQNIQTIKAAVSRRESPPKDKAK